MRLQFLNYIFANRFILKAIVAWLVNDFFFLSFGSVYKKHIELIYM
jgi:hypothetical protein